MITLFEEFCAFISEQPSEATINHSKGWCGCAVGEFLDTEKYDEYLGNAGELADALEHQGTVAYLTLQILNGNGDIDQIAEDNREVFDALVKAGFEYDCIKTYGELRRCIQTIKNYL